MVLVVNKKTKEQMDNDLSLFLGHNTEQFTSWLTDVLDKLNTATTNVAEPQQQQPVAVQSKALVWSKVISKVRLYSKADIELDKLNTATTNVAEAPAPPVAVQS